MTFRENLMANCQRSIDSLQAKLDKGGLSELKLIDIYEEMYLCKLFITVLEGDKK